MKKNNLFIGILAIMLVFGMSVIGCKEDSTDDSNTSNWWTYVSSDSTANVSMIPTSNDIGCDVSVTGTANSINKWWCVELGYSYTATAGKTYKVTWKWSANSSPFTNVRIRYAYQEGNEGDYLLGAFINTLTIPSSEETKTFEFTVPVNCKTNFSFMIGMDTGSFKIRDFKIEEQVAGNGGGVDTLTLSGQVYRLERTKNPSSGVTTSMTYTPYTGNLTFNNTNTPYGDGTIINGQLSYTLGTPTTAQITIPIRNLLIQYEYNNPIVTPSDAKCAGFGSLRTSGTSDYYTLRRGAHSVSTSGNSTTIGGTQVEVFLYVDKDCTVTAVGRTYTDDGVTITLGNVNLSLKKGWNIICSSGGDTFNNTTGGTTASSWSSWSVGDQSTLKWFLQEK